MELRTFEKNNTMKQLFLAILTLTIFFGCKSETQKELTTAQKIANVHGFEKWGTVSSFEFTFGGNDTIPNSGRSWIWKPKTNDITLTRNGERFSYNRNDMDSVAIKNDRAFINDKFWALIPFQLIWDSGATISEVEEMVSPVKAKNLNKITITYSSEGGYTPGDAYDIFFDDEYIIREWTFRRGNQDEPSLSNTFENYSDYHGLYLAKDHNMAGSDRNLQIRNIKVELD